MEFLQHSRSHQHLEKENVVSRSREKDRKKASRAQDEISTFFKPNRAPLQDLSSNRSGPSHEFFTSGSNLYTKQLDSERDVIYRRDSEPLNFPSETSRELEVTEPTSDRYQVGYGFSASPAVNHSINVPGSTSKASGNATTYVTWSESQRSPASTSHHDSIGHRSISPIPDSVCRSIEKTGIFKDTGIKGPLKSYQANVSPGVNERQNSRTAQIAHRLNLSDRMSTKSANPTEARIERPQDFREDGEQVPEMSERNPRDVIPELQKRADQSQSTNQTWTIEQQGTSRKRIVIERFDPAFGWREDLNAVECSQQTAASPLKRRTSYIAEPTPPTRAEIAKKARVKIPKRPSTTVPILQSTRLGTQMPVHSEENHLPVMDNDARPPKSEEGLRTTGFRAGFNSVQRPLLSRASNLSLPTIHEDSDEQSASHCEVSLPERQVESTNAAEVIQPRLDVNWNNNTYQYEKQLQQPIQGSYVQQETYEGDDIASRNETYLGLHMGNAWLGTSLSSVNARPVRLQPQSGPQSLYVRQVQQSSMSCQVGYDGSNSSTIEASRNPPRTVSPVYDGRYGYANQHQVEDLAEHGCTLDRGNISEVYQGYEEGRQIVNDQYYDELGTWDAETHHVDPRVYDMEEGHVQGYYEQEHMAPEQNYSSLQPMSYYGDHYEPQADNHHNGFWQPSH